MEDKLGNISRFHAYREKYAPKTPEVLTSSALTPVETPAVVSEAIKGLFPQLTTQGVVAINFKPNNKDEGTHRILRVGCVLSGGQAAGGHNVIIGIYDYIKRLSPSSQLFGFLNGPAGIFNGKYVDITDAHAKYYRNRGGFDMICSGRDKISTPEQFQNSLKHCESLKLDGLVIIGGDDSNTNAALLAEYFLSKGSRIRVVGCPKTIDGDLKNQFIEVSFGFDTACRTYAECISSVMTDTLSSKKYYHFIRLMGRSASHIALQCALITRPTYTFIGEQVQKLNLSLSQLVENLVDVIVARASQGKDYGVVLIPEGLIEFIPDMNSLIGQINALLAGVVCSDLSELRNKIVLPKLGPKNKAIFQFLPLQIADQLLLDRDPHGNVQVAKIETERFIISLVQEQLSKRANYTGKFSPLSNYFGYEGRCAFPTNFDCDYCYSLGLNAAAIIESGRTGLMSCVRNLNLNPEQWLPGGYPLVTMMDIETRHNKQVPVITKALVELNSPLFRLFADHREEWSLKDTFNLVGPVQYEFPSEPPFLAVPPKLENLYFSTTEPSYEQGIPFVPIRSINMNKLTYSLAEEQLELPPVLKGSTSVVLSKELKFNTNDLQENIAKEYPYLYQESVRLVNFERKDHPSDTRKIKIGVSFNGRQCPGGHNAVFGLLADNTEIYGFIGGTDGLFKGDYIIVSKSNIKFFYNQSGFHFLGRTADKIRSIQQREKVRTTCLQLKLDGLVLIGASHTLTDGVGLANHFIKEGCKTKVNVIPSSIDNNIYDQNLQASIGFATSSQMYSSLICNLMIDASSNTKYWYFIRLMGRDPSHLTLECALTTRPNYTIISEEVQSKGWDLEDIVEDIIRVIIRRQQKGLGFGCILVPEGLPTFLPSIVRIKTELDQINLKDPAVILAKMSAWAQERYQRLPSFIQTQLQHREKSTNALVLSQFETEKLLAHLVGQRLKQLKQEKLYKGSFSAVCHFFGYQGRCATPNLLDRSLGYVYGSVARLLIQNGLSGYCASARGLARQSQSWMPLAIPLISMMRLKDKSIYGQGKPIVRSSNVYLDSAVFRKFSSLRSKWELTDYYEGPGPIQHFGQLRTYCPLTLELVNFKDSDGIEKQLEEIKNQCRFGAEPLKLQIVSQSLSNLLSILKSLDESR